MSKYPKKNQPLARIRKIYSMILQRKDKERATGKNRRRNSLKIDQKARTNGRGILT
tara:strand:+ start:134 stop:301 length:168 start_codon:yes stop_codon:yes gene_type:complete